MQKLISYHSFSFLLPFKKERQVTKRFIITLLSISLFACAVPPAIKNHYTLTQYGTKVVCALDKLPSIYISTPEAVVGFQTDQMLYRHFPFHTSAYAHNAWSSAPHEMLYPLIIQSLQESHAFRVVGSGIHSEVTKYRLDTQLLELVQNYQTKPSRVQIKLKAMISDTITAKIIASKIFRYSMPCPSDTPLGGAAAANRAVAMLTADLTAYTITVVQQHHP